MGGIGNTADRLVVLGAAVGGRKGERDTSQLAGLVEHTENFRIHMLDPRPASVLASELIG